MTPKNHLLIAPLGMSLGLFFVVTYLLCILYGAVASTDPMRQLLPMLLPGFRWLTWPDFLVGFAWSFIYGWYTAIVFVPIYNYFSGKMSVASKVEDNPLTSTESSLDGGSSIKDRLTWICTLTVVLAAIVILWFYGVTLWTALIFILMGTCPFVVLWVLMVERRQGSTAGNKP